MDCASNMWTSWEDLQRDCGRVEMPSVMDLIWFLGLQTRQLVTKEIIRKRKKTLYLHEKVTGWSTSNMSVIFQPFSNLNKYPSTISSGPGEPLYSIRMPGASCHRRTSHKDPLR